MAKKTVNFNQDGIGKLPNNKPVVYKILTESGKINYTGVAKRGRVQDRLQEHLGTIPGAKVKIEEFHSISDALKQESKVIKGNGPKYNDQGK